MEKRRLVGSGDKEVREPELDYYADKYLKWKEIFGKYLKVTSRTTFQEFYLKAMQRKGYK